MFIEFVIQNQLFSYSLEEFAQILDIPCEGAYVFTDKWSLDELAYGVPTDGPYQTNHPSPDDIISSIRTDREGQVRRIRHEEEIDVHEYQILTHEIVPTLKPLKKIVQEKIVFLSGELCNESCVLSTNRCHESSCPLNKSEKTRRDRAREEVSTPLLTPVFFFRFETNHPHSHLNDYDMMMENGEGPRVQASLPPFC
ncbi:hypothetical protein Tco_0535068 [Tanacetum coccineum]